MRCTSCSSKSCRTDAKDCFDVKEMSLSIFQDPKISSYARSASLLIDNGRAGTLNRTEEVLEYIKDQGYERVGVAYCFGIPHHAQSLEKRLKAAGTTPIMVQCTAGGVLEKEIAPEKTNGTTSCNPVGQALALEKKKAEFVIEMGLCMGHDVIFHENLKIPHTTLLVKDRIYKHNPAVALEGHKDLSSQFLEEMDDSFRMVTPEYLEEMQRLDSGLTILDLRSEEKFREGHIPGSINTTLKELPDKFNTLLPDKRQKIITVCNGSVQSAYAIMFLFGRGYKDVHNLSGGFTRWQKEGRAIDRSSEIVS